MNATQRERLRRQLDAWKAELVNLDRRNGLLYFKHTRSSTLEIEAPKMASLWKRISNGDEFRFYPPPEPDSDDPDGFVPTIDPAHDQLVTQKATVADLDRTVRGLDRRARQVFMDTGFNIVYLGFGLLRWNDGEQDALAPLLLQPVVIERPSTNAPFRVRAAEGDAVVNPALVVKLDRDFDVQMDSFDIVELSDVLAEFRQIATDQIGWSVEERVVLGAFTFFREAMYRDLNENDDVIAENALIQTMAIGPSAGGLDDLVFDPIDESELDRTAPATTSYVVADADSTQRICIHAAGDGRSFVMDGPPGTGKSQTITNMIAELLHAGKTVLFVSEKAAALDVVYQRLQRVQLDRFVLELHSHKATRKEVAQELGRALMERPTATTSFSASDRSRLNRLVTDLSGYATALNEVRRPLDRSMFDVLGELVSLDGAPTLDGPDIDIAEIGPDDEAALEELSGDLARAWGPVDRGDAFLWRDIELERIDQLQPGELGRRLDVAIEATVTLDERIQHVDADLGIDWPRRSDDAARRLTLLQLIEGHEHRRRIPVGWLTHGVPATIDDIAELDRCARALNGARSAIDGLRVARWSDLDPEHRQQMESRLVALATAVPKGDLPGHHQQNDVRRLHGQLASAAELADDIGNTASEIAARFSLGDEARDAGVDRLRELAELAQMVATADRPEGAWLNPLVQASLNEAVRTLSTLVEDYRGRQEIAEATFAPSVIELDLEALKSRLDGVSGFGKLGSVYRSAKSELTPHVRSGKVKRPTIEALDHAIAWKRVSEQLTHAEHERAAQLGRYYAGRESTDLNRLQRVVEAARRALELVEGRAAGSLPAPGTSSVPGDAYEALAAQLGASVDPDITTHQLGVRLAELLDRWAALELDPVLPPAGSPGPTATWARFVSEQLGAVADILGAVEEVHGSPPTIDRSIQLLAARDEVARAEAQWSTTSGRVVPLLAGVDVDEHHDFVALRSDLEWSQAVRSRLDHKLEDAEAAYVLELDGLANSIGAAIGEQQRALGAVTELFQPDRRLAIQADLDVSFDDTLGLLDELAETQSDIGEWERFRAGFAGLEQLGFGAGLAGLVQREATAYEVVPALRASLLAAWANDILTHDERLQPLHSADRNAAIETFRQLDERRVRDAAAMVINECTKRRPAMAVGAAATIRREAEKKTRHMPIRTLIEETEEIVLRLKPCFMMSPMSVSHFLPSSIRFDAVIFDEASQVKPSEAINCIYRGAQLIVAGDPRQLPPTSFFQRSADNDDEYDEDEPDDFESVLDLMRSSGVPTLPLSWHYRSQHESLITFSNRRFYDSRLYTFPGAISEAPDVGVDFFHVPDGVYERGGARDNPIEARAVVERVLFHMRHHPS